MAVTDEDKLFADMWMKQKEIFFRYISFIPVVEIAVLASWFGLIKDRRSGLAQITLVCGAFVMLIASVMIWRSTQYVSYFRNKISHLFSEMSTPTINTRRIAV